MKDIFDAIMQAIIQGLTEFLPISSSGHLKLYQHLTNQSAEEGTFMLVVLHLGTLLAVIIAFKDTVWALFKELFSTLKAIFTGKFSFKEMNPERRMLVMLFISCLVLIPFYVLNKITGIFEVENLIILGICFLYTSGILYLSDKKKDTNKTIGDITTKDALTVGLFQCIALFPGISRSGSTISGGLFRGFDRETAVRYSFVLGIPAILGGCVSELSDALNGEIDVKILPTIIGFVVAAVVGLLAIKMVKMLIKSDNFKVFSIYTLIIGVLTVICGIIELISGQQIFELIAK